MAQALPYILTAVTVGGTAASMHQQKKAQAATEKAEEASGATAAIENQRAIRQQILRGRIASAQATAAAGNNGGGFGSSGFQGAISSSTSQTGSNVGAIRTSQAGQSAVQNNLSQARGFQSNAATFGALSSLPGQLGFSVKDFAKEKTNQSDVAGTV